MNPGTTAAKAFDVVAGNQSAFVLMAVLMLIFVMVRVAKATRVSVRKLSSFVHWWMAAYVIMEGFLMSLTTTLALVLLYDGQNQPRVPPSSLPLAAAILGVFGFEFLFSKFIIGLGENKFDLDATLQTLLDQAVAATLEREAA